MVNKMLAKHQHVSTVSLYYHLSSIPVLYRHISADILYSPILYTLHQKRVRKIFLTSIFTIQSNLADSDEDPEQSWLSGPLIKGIVWVKGHRSRCTMWAPEQPVFHHSVLECSGTRPYRLGSGLLMKCSISVISLPFSRSIKPHTFIALLCISAIHFCYPAALFQLWAGEEPLLRLHHEVIAWFSILWIFFSPRSP